MEMMTFSAKTVEDAVTKALIELETTSDKLEYEVVEKGSTGFLGIGAKPAVIRARKKESIQDKAVNFLTQVFDTMDIEVQITAAYNEEEKEISITLEGDDMGILIGKRGQTLDSLQYLVSLIVNKDSEEYLRVKLDTENYRDKRRKTLETLAKNIAYKVKRGKKPVSLEPMNPYERRIIHAAVQQVQGATSTSIGDEPNRRIVISSTVPQPRRSSSRSSRSSRGGRYNNSRYEGGRRSREESKGVTADTPVAESVDSEQSYSAPAPASVAENTAPSAPKAKVQDGADQPLYSKIEI